MSSEPMLSSTLDPTETKLEWDTVMAQAWELWELEPPTILGLLLKPLFGNNNTKVSKMMDFRWLFCRSGGSPDIERFKPAGGTPALQFKYVNMWD